MSNERVVVKFTASWRGYSKGERAGFDAAQAKALIDGKVAEQVKGVPAAAPKGAAGKAGGGSGGQGKGGAANTKPAEGDTPPPATEPPAPETIDTPPPADDDDEPKP